MKNKNENWTYRLITYTRCGVRSMANSYMGESVSKWQLKFTTFDIIFVSRPNIIQCCLIWVSFHDYICLIYAGMTSTSTQAITNLHDFFFFFLTSKVAWKFTQEKKKLLDILLDFRYIYYFNGSLKKKNYAWFSTFFKKLYWVQKKKKKQLCLICEDNHCISSTYDREN